MKVRTYFDAVTCDACRKVEKDPVDWYTLRAHFEVQDFGQQSNGALNAQIDRRHYDACSRQCAETLRETLLTINKVGRR